VVGQDADDSGCQSCHGNPVRPIWGPYPDWPRGLRSHSALAEGMVTWMSKHARWNELRYDLLEAQWCGGSDKGCASDLYTMLGLTAANDFNVAFPVHSAPTNDIGWNQGSTGLPQVVKFRRAHTDGNVEVGNADDLSVDSQNLVSLDGFEGEGFGVGHRG